MAILLLTFIAVVTVMALAYRGYLHPGDYLVAATLAVLLAAFVIILSPNTAQHMALLGHGTPSEAVARSAFLLRNGLPIELAAVLFAVGTCAAALIRRRTWH